MEDNCSTISTSKFELCDIFMRLIYLYVYMYVYIYIYFFFHFMSSCREYRDVTAKLSSGVDPATLFHRTKPLAASTIVRDHREL